MIAQQVIRLGLFRPLLQLLLLPLLIIMAGCVPQQETRTGEAATGQVAADVPQLPFTQRWSLAWSNDVGSGLLRERVRGKQLKRVMQSALSHNRQPQQAVRHLRQAIAHTEKARAQMHAVFKYREAGGISLEVSWERQLWKTIEGQLARTKTDAGLLDADLLAARQSLQGQAVKGWFYLRATQRHRLRAAEERQIYQQLRERAETGFTLARVSKEVVQQTRKEEQAAVQRMAGIKNAERLAVLALAELSGVAASELQQTSEESRVLQLSAGMPLAQLAQRPDVRRAGSSLAGTFAGLSADELIELPEVTVTAKYGKPAKPYRRLLARHSGLIDAGYPLLTKRATLTASQQQQLEHYDKVMWQAMTELNKALRRGRSLQNQYAERKDQRKQATTYLKAIRARYNAGRTDLSEVLTEQLPVLAADAASGYMLNRMYGQRIDSYLAAGVVTPLVIPYSRTAISK